MNIEVSESKVKQTINALSQRLLLEASEMINGLNHAERIAVRESADEQGLPLPRNLYYDYSKQQWIK